MVKAIKTRGSDDDASEAIIRELISAQAALSTMSPDGRAVQILKEITGQWMSHMKKKVNIPMGPHYTQSLVLLICHAFYCKRLGSEVVGGKSLEQLQALIAEVGTGEGKSLIIAMLSIYFVKAHGKQVHILENNEGLLERDFASMH